MEITEYEKSCNILNIVVIDENELTEKVLKKFYHKCCLNFHPDKNKEVPACKFIEIINAYDYLNKYMGYTDDDSYDEYDDNYNEYDYNNEIQIVVNPLIKTIGKMIVSNTFVTSYVDNMSDSNFKTLFKLFEKTLN